MIQLYAGAAVELTAYIRLPVVIPASDPHAKDVNGTAFVFKPNAGPSEYAFCVCGIGPRL